MQQSEYAEIHYESRVKSVMTQTIGLLRWPVMCVLVVTGIAQLFGVFVPNLTIIKPEQVNLPDFIQPMNTAILALLWWRISQLEEQTRYLRDRLDKLADHSDERDDRDHKPRMRR
jgi:hypothetical protein